MNKYEILYKRGLIDEKEYQEKMQELTLNLQFEDKLNKELKQFKKDLKKKSKYEIMEKCYELTCKEEIKNELLNLQDDKKEYLYLKDDILDELYQEWVKVDGQLVDSMRDSIEESVTRKMQKDIDER